MRLLRACVCLAALVAPCRASSELTGRDPYHPLLDSAHRDLVGPHSLDPAVDCAMRTLTWQYAQAVLPLRAPAVAVFDALRLAVDCNATRPPAPPAAAAPGARALPAAAASYFVDAAVGVDDDQRDGSAGQPFKSVAFAVARARTGAQPAAVLLTDAAPFYLAAPLALGPEDDGLTLAAAPGAATMPIVSGGAPLSGLAWTRVGPAPGSGVNGTPVMTIWSADLSASGAALPFDQLYAPAGAGEVGGRRATRARWPNGNPEVDQAPNGYTKANATHGWAPAPPFPDNLVQQNPLHTPLVRRACAAAKAPCEPGGDKGDGPPWAIFCCFFWGVNATATNFTTGSFWATQPGPPGGGTAQMPGGMLAGPDTHPRMAAWGTGAGAIIHAFHNAYWGNWLWEIQSVDASSGAVAFARGGWQEARGSGAGDLLYFENIAAELDWAGEWYVDAAAATLLYVANGTAAPPADGWVAAQLDGLVRVTGAAGVPARGITLQGLAFMHTRTTHLEPFTVPSGGDMSFHDGGAVRLQGTENCAVRGSLFRNLGGSGVMIAGYNADAAVDGNEFVFVGESAVMAMGLGGDRQNNLDGDVPTRTAVTNNFAHEFGLYVKQTGFFYQAMSANSSILNNVFFNGPRAGININDGFAGGHTMKKNVGFNLVRETSDHGVFNSWDRNTYQAHAWDPANLETLPIIMDQNLFICNYRAFYPIDNDDGSNSYVQTRNVLLWGGAKNLMGYNKQFIGNAYVYSDFTPATTSAVRALPLPLAADTPAMRAKYPVELSPMRRGGLGSGNGVGVCANSIAPWPAASLGLADQFRNNTCIVSNKGNIFEWFNPCNDSNPTDGSMFLMSGNSYMTGDGVYLNRCNASAWNLTAAQSHGVDLGSTVSTLPSVDAIVGLAHALLGF